MAYDLELARRLRNEFDGMKNVEEKEMFGGICFMLNEKMCVGIVKDHLMVRFDPAMQDEVLSRRGASPMDFTNRTMKGYAFVAPEAIASTKDLRSWIDLAVEYNPKATPSKKKAKKKKVDKKRKNVKTVFR